MGPNRHIDSEWPSPPNEVPREKLGVLELSILKAIRFNDAFPNERDPPQSILSSCSARVAIAALYLASVFLLCPFILRVCLCPDPVGECAGARRSMAPDRIHAMERAADLRATAPGLYPGGIPVLMDAFAARARAAPDPAFSSSPGGS